MGVDIDGGGCITNEMGSCLDRKVSRSALLGVLEVDKGDAVVAAVVDVVVVVVVVVAIVED